MGSRGSPPRPWGVGNDAPDAAEEGYTPRTVSLAGDAQVRLRRGLWAGVGFDLSHRRFVEQEDSGLIASGALGGAVDGRVMGVGVVLTWDSRNNSAFPRMGGLYQLRALGYGDAVGSDFGFTKVSLDARRYLPVFGRHVVAVRVVGMGTAGAPPFDHLPRLGGEVLLRGYYEGRFRDCQLVALQAEYRAPVWWRFGVVAFGAAGQVAPRFADVALERFRVSAGGGIRFRFTGDGMNIRLDVARGIGRSSGGLYLGVREAF